MKVVIIKYNAGNCASVNFALERIGVSAIISENFEEIRSADKVIFPGVGAAGSAMQYLREKKLDQLIINLKQPVLGICLGMQLMCEHSEEGDVDCLGIFNQKIKLFQSTDLKVPQVGWNKIYDLKGKIFNGLENDYVYFVHSYYAQNSVNTIASAEYGISYSAALQKNNFYGVQFHPEKSGDFGSKILENFINSCK